ncbi:hypothetical protein HYPSUDRAFT_204922 [Hypholoma sublateritium FD-334 SS-4]|uniref:Uncharacterized protein n=1 Tax=Hypholoma sublateritium (strain FD-334 SS-4) TaxID=945553 RepID=A0A0D2M701_HYPSF|nr:hypothetical protein HYPSUDRAFT_204922 [Hypholoma sublateritium FD-334 SS-4]
MTDTSEPLMPLRSRKMRDIDAPPAPAQPARDSATSAPRMSTSAPVSHGSRPRYLAPPLCRSSAHRHRLCRPSRPGPSTAPAAKEASAVLPAAPIDAAPPSVALPDPILPSLQYYAVYPEVH